MTKEKKKIPRIFSEKSREEMKAYDPSLTPESADMGAEEIGHEEYLKKIREKDAILVCVTYLIPGFEDNIRGTCDECGATIYYRPYNKKATKKICIDCARKKEEF